MDIKETIEGFIDTLFADKKVHSLILSAPPGLGKTTTVLEHLQNLGLRDGVNFIYKAGYVTPLKFFQILSTTRILESPRCLVLDDVDSLLANKTSLALLKASLSEAMKKRVVTYESRGVNVKEFDFKGKVIIITNHLATNKALLPLTDRAIVYDFESNPAELAGYINDNLAEFGDGLTEEQRQSVWAKVQRFVDSPNFSLRTVYKAFAFYRNNNENWYSLWMASLKY